LKYYLDEDIIPKVAELLRREDVDAVSVHEIGMTQKSDLEQLEFAAEHGRCLVTRNRLDFIRLTLLFFNEQKTHFGILIIPHTLPGDRFSLMVRALKKYSLQHPKGMEAYTIDFLSA